MKFARVIGTVVATQKDDGISHRKMLLIQPISSQLNPTGDTHVAIDAVGAGFDEIVLFASGSSARQTVTTKDTPCDCVIMAIVDLIEIDGNIVYDKSKQVL